MKKYFGFSLIILTGVLLVHSGCSPPTTNKQTREDTRPAGSTPGEQTGENSRPAGSTPGEPTEENTRPTNQTPGDDGRVGMINPNAYKFYAIYNRSGRQVHIQYNRGRNKKRQILPVGGCLYHPGFSFPFGIYIRAGGTKVCGSEGGSSKCQFDGKSTSTLYPHFCGPGAGQNLMCPFVSGASFEITPAFSLKERGQGIERENLSSSCIILGEERSTVPPQRQTP